MGYVYSELSDFLEDNYFKKWVYAPTPELDIFWTEFNAANPEKSELVAQARSILLMLGEDFEEQFPDENVVSAMWENIQEQKSTNPLPATGKSYRLWISFASAAAAVLLIIGWVYKPEHRINPVTYLDRISHSSVKLAETKNTQPTPLLVKLPDNSTVLLQPGSSLSYPQNFDEKNNREVYLSGEGFFRVTKNKKRPFIVYANEVVTRVLGTSFSVKAFENDLEVEVEVKTGRVSVFAMDPSAERNFDELDTSKEIIVTPNQKILYSRNSESIRKYMVEVPEIVPSDFASPPILDFEDAKVSDIFQNLEQSYEIEIVYDKQRLGNCLLTASFTNESLYDKIDLICKGIEAEFKVENGKIVVAGRGCH
jgi:transmembrane sensor